MSFPRYPKYKDSGVEWLGQVPEQWEVRRLATVFSESVEQGSEDLPILSVSIHDGVSDKEMSDDEVDRKVTRSDDKSKYVRVRPGDLVYNMMRAWQGGFGCVAVEGMVSPAYVVARPRIPIITAFVERLLRTPAAVEQMRRHSKGITDFRLRLYWEEFKNIRVALPTEVDQRAIAGFLDIEVAKIDVLVAEQERLVELLTEKVSSLALSSIPIRKVRLGSVAEKVSRPVMQCAGEVYTPIGLFNRGRGLFHKDARDIDEMGDSDFFWIEAGDLILSGQFAWEGAVALAGKDEDGCVASHRYHVLRGRPQLAVTEYLLALLSTEHGAFLLNEHSRGAAGRNRPLNIDSLLKEKIPVPSIRDQELIAEAVHARQRAIQDSMVAIELLNQRRNALISAVVTGQIDVRGGSIQEVA